MRKGFLLFLAFCVVKTPVKNNFNSTILYLNAPQTSNCTPPILPPLLLQAHHFAILWASVGNTIPATFWAMYYLVTHQEALAAVFKEIQNVLNLSGIEELKNRDITFTKDQLDGLLYLGKIALSIFVVVCLYYILLNKNKTK